MRLVPHQDALTPPSRPDGCAFGFFKGAFAWISTGAGACRSPCGKHVSTSRCTICKGFLFLKWPPNPSFASRRFPSLAVGCFSYAAIPPFAGSAAPSGRLSRRHTKSLAMQGFWCFFRMSARRNASALSAEKWRSPPPLPAVKSAGAMPPFGLSHRHIHFCCRSGRSLWRAGTTRSASGEGCGRSKATQGWRSA